MGEQRRQNTNTYCEKSRKKLKKLNEKLKIENTYIHYILLNTKIFRRIIINKIKIMLMCEIYKTSIFPT